MKIERRQFLTASTALLATAAAPRLLAADFPLRPQPERYPDSAWEVMDERFREFYLFNTPLERHWSGGLWVEGPAWNAVGRYVVFSDIPRARQMRWDEATGETSVLREKVGHSNGNTFDPWGRLVACEHSPARVVRYEWDGSTSVLAEQYQGRPLNAPNDLVALPEGGIIFTDPGYGAHADYEGKKRPLELKPAVYYVDDTLEEPLLLTQDIYKPNGITLAADGKTLYISDTAPSHFPQQPARIIRWTLGEDGRSLNDRHELVSSHDTSFDGLTCDVQGNIWSSASGGEGIDGVAIFSPKGELLGRILLPEVCSNLCFIGEDRNRLFMTASQSVYTLYTGARGV
ncbi:SMP-30/gluconolactonase/LRE family protein [Halomonas sp. WWR20]